jgi:hypothetical protein
LHDERTMARSSSRYASWCPGEYQGKNCYHTRVILVLHKAEVGRQVRTGAEGECEDVQLDDFGCVVEGEGRLPLLNHSVSWQVDSVVWLQ